MNIVLQNVLWVVSFVACQYSCLANETVTIGVLYSEENAQIGIVLNSLISIKNKLHGGGYFKSYIEQISNLDSFEASKTLCKVLETNDGVAAVIGLESRTSAIVKSICSHFEVPYIMTSWQPPSPSGLGTVLNLFPKAELYAQALADVVKSLQWSSFIILYETEEGLTRLQEVLKLQNFKQNKKQNNILVKKLGPGQDYRLLLKEIRNASENNIILDCKTEHIIPILKQAKDQNLLTHLNNYFLTSLDAHALNYSVLETAANITTIKLLDYDSDNFRMAKLRWVSRPYVSNYHDYYTRLNAIQRNPIKIETVLFYDALLLIIDTVSLKYSEKNITPNAISCYEQTKSKNGYTLASHIKEMNRSYLLSGPLKFDDYGNRIDFNIHVVDILDNQVIADWFASNNSLLLRRNSNDTEFAAVENLQNNTIRVSSRLGRPYLMYREGEKGKTPHGNDRYEGYSMDLIMEILKIIGFTLEFHLTEDNEYGRWDENKKKWTGLVGDILEGRAELAIGDLTITHQRREVVDFSMPFMTLGISILYMKENNKDFNMFAFLDPFSVSVWVYTATLYLIISVILYFISRMTPGDWENPHPCDEDPEELENIWDIKNCLWLALGSMLTQGCDILPKGISSRMLVSMLWFFSIIITSSYTANLAALLTKEEMEPTIDSAEALSKQTQIKYGAVEGGSTMAFFKDSNYPTYQRMWINMVSSNPSVFEKSNEDGVKRVQASKGNYAFLMESTHIEHVIETNCDLKQVGSSLDAKSYGIAMPKNAPYRSAINKAILKLQENEKLNALKKKWWKDKRTEPSCDSFEEEEKADDSADLALANVGGVFFILGIGIAIAVILAVFEFLWNVRRVSVEEHLTYWEALKVELTFACNVWITKKRTKPVISESSNAGSHMSDKADNRNVVHSIL